MSFDTRDETLDQIMTMKKPLCPHCQGEMNLWEVPPISFSDGLGWGVPFLFICFNDDCPLFKQGWDELLEQVGQKSSVRCMNYPGTTQFEMLPVFSSFGGTGQLVTDDTVAKKKAHEEAIKTGFSILADCYVNTDLVQIMKMALDGEEPTRVRLKAAEMLGDLADTEAIDPLRNTKFANPKLQEEVLLAVNKIHTRCYTRECPFCAEIIKKQAKICKHCKTEVAGH
ncbi:MAG: HEAT repeat domain-containing protein [Proteobacteria bacterium]|nr:HEAT repeat domain-containing protein [Pseudomonadota bacterium]